MATATPSLTRPQEVPRDRFEQEVVQYQGQVLVELWRPGKDAEFFTRALAEQAQRHPEVKLVRINVDEYGDLIREYHRRRAINQTYDLAHVPGVALFRNGKLITTMKPLIVNSDPELIAHNVRRQLDVFMAKFVEDVKTTVPTDESDAPGGAGDGAADDKDAKIKAALEKAAKLKAERAKQKAAAGEGAPAAGPGKAGAAAGAGEAAAAPAARAGAAGAADKDARVQAALEKAARLKAERAKQQAATQGGATAAPDTGASAEAPAAASAATPAAAATEAPSAAPATEATQAGQGAGQGEGAGTQPTAPTDAGDQKSS